MESEAVCGPVTPAIRRYTRMMAIAGGLYAAVVLVSIGVAERFHPTIWAAILLGLAPMIPALLMLRAYLVLFRSLDEFQRRVQSEAILVSAALVGFASLGYGFLEATADLPRISLIWVLPALIALWGISAAVISRRYR